MEGPANPFNIDRTIFNKEDQRTQDLHLQLSEKYMVYKDYADRAIINPAQIGKPLLFVTGTARQGRPPCLLHQARIGVHEGTERAE